MLARALRPGVLARVLATLFAAPKAGDCGEVAPRGEAHRVTRLSVDAAKFSVGTLAVAGPVDGECRRGDETAVAKQELRTPGVEARAAVTWRGLPESDP